MTKNNRVVVICSKDRPLQLELCLSSYHNHCFESYETTEPKVFVIYKVSNERFEKAYQTLIEEYPIVKFIKETNFKENLILCTKNNDKILFLTDDNIFTDHFSLEEMDLLLDAQPESLGFSLRLGKNTNYCYSMNKAQKIPDIISIYSGKYKFIYKYDWTKSELDFNYPLEISSSYYRIKDILKIIQEGQYNHPNFFEWILYNNLNYYKNVMPYLFCYDISVAFCAPMNKVQNTNNNRNSEINEYSIENLLIEFENGKRINFNNFSNFVSNSCHQEVSL